MDIFKKKAAAEEVPPASAVAPAPAPAPAVPAARPAAAAPAPPGPHVGRARILLAARRDGAVVGEAVTRRDGRLVFAGWLSASLALAAAVYASERALDSREKGRAAAILGTPLFTPPPSLAPARPVEAGSDAQR